MKVRKKSLEVKTYWSPDILEPWQWFAEDNAVFYLLEMTIGVAGEAHADIYSVMVATPEGLLAGDENRLDRFYKIILLRDYSWEKVVSIVEAILAGIAASDDKAISRELSKYFHWEYDAMK